MTAARPSRRTAPHGSTARPVGALVLAAVLATVMTVGVASASWNPTGSGSASAVALSVPDANQPSVSVSSLTVTVNWSATTISGTAASSYTVWRTDTAGNNPVVPTSGTCSTNVTGTSCTETNTPSGSWKYQIAANFARWQGQPSPLSSSAAVSGPALTLTATSVTSLPATITGTVTNFPIGTGLIFKLDSGSGTVLTGTPTTTSGNSTSISVTLPSGTTNGSHSLYVVGGNGQTTAASFTVNVSAGGMSLAIANTNGGTVGKPETGDTVTVSYGSQLNVSTICSTWSGNATNQSLANATVTIVDNGSSTGKDDLRIASSTCALQFGTVNLGTTNFVSSSVTFTNSTITWTAATNRLTITLGTLSGSVSTRTTTYTATYTPNTALRNSSGTAITGTATTNSRLF